jgi:hypothetical protein
VEADGKGAESLRYICSRIYTIHGIFSKLDRYQWRVSRYGQFHLTIHPTNPALPRHSSSLFTFLADAAGGGWTFRITLLYLLIGGVPLPVTSKIT